MNTCWNCEHYTNTGGHGSYNWGFCKLTNNNVDSDETCEKFAEICVNKTEYSIHSLYDSTDRLYPYKVVTNWNGGSRSERKSFNSMEQAGEYIQKIEAFLKYRKD